METMISETTKIQFTNDQLAFLNEFKVWINNPDPFMVLSGSAGSGKSFITTEAIKEAKNTPGIDRIGICAPTHKALRVISDKITDSGLSVSRDIWLGEGADCYLGTLHSFISACPFGQIDPEDDDVDFLPIKGISEQPIAQYDLIVCDEASMVSAKFYSFLLAATNQLPVKVLFVGDEFQLYPVEKVAEISPVFSLQCRSNLREVVRYSGDILKEASRIREAMEDGLNTRAYSFRNYDQDDFKVIRDRKGYQASAWFDSILDHAARMRDDRNINQDWFRVLTFRRKTMESINHEIRQRLYGESAKENYIRGEWLFTHGQCSSYIPMQDRLELINEGKDVQVIRLGNSRDFQIKEVSHRIEPLPNPLPDLLPDFPELYQPLNVVFINAYDSNGTLSLREFAVLTVPQLEVFNKNCAVIESVLTPVMDQLDLQLSVLHGELASQKRKQRAILAKYLRSLRYCYNISETVQYSHYPPKPEDAAFTRTVTENGRSVQKRVLSKFQPAYCITVHKAQGSTMNHVFVNYQDFFAARSSMDTMYRLLYTALTRASESVSVYSMY